ncbi:hypothetical protein CUMW_117820 [Citrus unshiu]|nr:hypothetical protein CUMW_117820 [Citrus unshiu]
MWSRQSRVELLFSLSFSFHAATDLHSTKRCLVELNIVGSLRCFHKQLRLHPHEVGRGSRSSHLHRCSSEHQPLREFWCLGKGKEPELRREKIKEKRNKTREKGT